VSAVSEFLGQGNCPRYRFQCLLGQHPLLVSPRSNTAGFIGLEDQDTLAGGTLRWGPSGHPQPLFLALGRRQQGAKGSGDSQINAKRRRLPQTQPSAVCAVLSESRPSSKEESLLITTTRRRTCLHPSILLTAIWIGITINSKCKGVCFLRTALVIFSRRTNAVLFCAGISFSELGLSLILRGALYLHTRLSLVCLSLVRCGLLPPQRACLYGYLFAQNLNDAY
jgi:hypothetical protein